MSDSHEFRVNYVSGSGFFQWWHSDGRKGSDPTSPGMADTKSRAIAESMHRRIDRGESELYFEVTERKRPWCSECGRSGNGVQFLIFGSRKPFGELCTDCEGGPKPRATMESI